MNCNCHGADESPARKDYQYAVKIVAGRISEKNEGNGPLPTGAYYTKVNIHNPSRCDCVAFKWKVALGLPNLKVGPISPFHSATLCADEALEIVNQDFIAAFSARSLWAENSDLADPVKDTEKREEPKAAPATELVVGPKPVPFTLPAHFEGWLVIETPKPLDVVAVYGTSPEDASGTITAFHTERVQPREMIPCEDLHANISTGVAIWEMKHPGATDFVYGVLSSRNPAWIDAPSGSVWLTPSGSGSIDEPFGDYVYRLPFKLCTGFESPRIDLNISADDTVKIKLNGAVVGGSGVNYISHKAVVITHGFKTGQNYLEIVVTNASREKNPTGMALSGYINVKGGKCPCDCDGGDGANGGIAVWSCPGITYKAHLEKKTLWDQGPFGWQNYVSNWTMAGTTSQQRRLEAFNAHHTGSLPPGISIKYQAHLEDIGDTVEFDEGDDCGTTNQNRRLEAVRFFFHPVTPPNWSIDYMLHLRSKHLWDTATVEPTASNGAWCGTKGQNRRAEALWVGIRCQ